MIDHEMVSIKLGLIKIECKGCGREAWVNPDNNSVLCMDCDPLFDRTISGFGRYIKPTDTGAEC